MLSSKEGLPKRNLGKLGRKGLRKEGGKCNKPKSNQREDSYDCSGQAKLMNLLQEEGFGLGTDEFIQKGQVKSCGELKTVRFVLPVAHTYKNMLKDRTVTFVAFKLASRREQEVASQIMNPFMQAMPFGSQKPLPR